MSIWPLKAGICTLTFLQARALCCLYHPIVWFIHPEWMAGYPHIWVFAWEVFIPWCRADFRLWICSVTSVVDLWSFYLRKCRKLWRYFYFFSSHQVLLSIIDVWKYSMPLKISLPEAILKWTATATLMYLIHPKCTSLQVKQAQHHWNISAHDPLQTRHMRRKSVHKNGMVHRHAV